MTQTRYNITDEVVKALKQSPLKYSCYREASPSRAEQFFDNYLDEYENEVYREKWSLGQGRKSVVIFTDSRTTFENVKSDLYNMDWQDVDSRASKQKIKRKSSKSDSSQTSMVISSTNNDDDSTLPRISFAVSNDVMESLEFLASANNITVNKLFKTLAEKHAKKAKEAREQLTQF